MKYSTREQREEVLRYCMLSMQYGLNFNTQGNISIRLPEHEAILVTPTDLEYDLMTPDDMVVVGYDGTVLEGEHGPSSEVTVHNAVYAERPDVQAIVHTEPIYSNIMGVLNRPIEGVLVNMIIYSRGPVPIMPFALSNNTEFGKAMAAVMGNTNAVVWGNHGLMTVGNSLRDAFKTTVAVESAAKVQHLASLVGTPAVLNYDALGLDHAL
ncbi:MAG: L-ribulose-5-phosphate 4-epimerase [Frankiales bacterium]|jgi:L-ribulose-5-phosphate 4-epimerase|nr:L-ribulose-5-phosphate 4-epimerase [Frankiales bacterium]